MEVLLGEGVKELKKGDKVRWKLRGAIRRSQARGIGKITQVFPPLGNVPWTCHVDTYKEGVLFEDEVKHATAKM